MNIKKQAFTLVELIVVITILAILGTIAFLSLQGYSVNSRDSVRVSDISKITLALELQLTKAGRVFVPENKIDITASGTLILYQGDMGGEIMSNIRVDGGGKDPLDNNYYTYSISAGLKKYQLMGFLENGDNIGYIKPTYASLKERIPYVKGNELGILLDSVTKEPVHRSGSTIDIVNTNIEYEVYLGNKNDEKFTGTGSEIITKLYATKEYIGNKELAKYDSSLVGYWDMETLMGTLLKDFSGYGNYGTCKKNETVSTDCGEKGNGYDFVKSNNGKAINFISSSNIDIGGDSSLHNPKEMTFSTLFRANFGGGTYQYLILRNNFQFRSNTEGGSRVLIWWHIDGNWKSNGISYPANNDLNINERVNAIITYNNNNLILYINGKKHSFGTLSGDITSPLNNMIIGKNSNETIDEVRIYNRALSEKEIQVLYYSMK